MTYLFQFQRHPLSTGQFKNSFAGLSRHFEDNGSILMIQGLLA